MMTIRDATILDARRIAEIHIHSWGVAYRGLVPDAVLDGMDVDKREAGWVKHLAGNTEHAIVAEDAGRVMGWATFGPYRDESGDAGLAGSGEVYGIYLDPAVFRRGIGRQLWQRAIADMTASGMQHAAVWVLVANAPARRFYEAMGCVLDVESQSPHVMYGVSLPKVRYWCNLTGK